MVAASGWLLHACASVLSGRAAVSAELPPLPACDLTITVHPFRPTQPLPLRPARSLLCALQA